MKTFEEYQKAAMDFAEYDNEMYPIASLMVEAAEFADLFVKPMLRGDDIPIHRKEVIKEAGDVLWQLTAALSQEFITLEEVAQANVEKLKRRQKNGTIRGSGER